LFLHPVHTGANSFPGVNQSHQHVAYSSSTGGNQSLRYEFGLDSLGAGIPLWVGRSHRNTDSSSGDVLFGQCHSRYNVRTNVIACWPFFGQLGDYLPKHLFFYFDGLPPHLDVRKGSRGQLTNLPNIPLHQHLDASPGILTKVHRSHLWLYWHRLIINCSIDSITTANKMGVRCLRAVRDFWNIQPTLGTEATCGTRPTLPLQGGENQSLPPFRGKARMGANSY